MSISKAEYSQLFDTTTLENKAMNTIKLKNNASVPIHGVKSGEVIEVKCDAVGTPLDKHWRRRLKDAQLDGAVTVVEAKGSKK